MKKLNITKEQFNHSKYFQKKYGKLEYVSESGKLFKTSKGHVLKFNESFGLTNKPKGQDEWDDTFRDWKEPDIDASGAKFQKSDAVEYMGQPVTIYAIQKDSSGEFFYHVKLSKRDENGSMWAWVEEDELEPRKMFKESSWDSEKFKK